ncbi:EF-P beta-lysylation protein EpmB [Colwellia sp. 1_MG-2023]|uniref:EF-P beta-lysylation protein EpmB n=1 Tax=unclassified Colwellia TaxID=196834 RepID=UPI001C08FE68|nr:MULTISPECIES: EF-P beta-lysylation protein EpmB [unclassified Colwellia]MBU2925059.1 EF-P beta-lysylation protein EpmB [Colwellia sp. C2M11]MDO6486464.1 EF-P beta-lysylation protein EpmB [Colwellia sp. 6_MG-2023]MDO6651648.1 EF-P beta-lysylation protein EpmB [Colwellia sp. 3_MG-2023]MDO6664954.1 EF-P beta-lysylation protein EpmB [Colwellia sp. 2_MG-2023]MDO6689327.1 EF-P beta-lysylation protein EpmB [Colwellia sp. 1_MG-2023]
MSQIITQIDPKLHLCDENSWQKDLRQVITDPEKLLTLLDINSAEYLQHFNAKQLFPVRVPLPFISRMKKSDFNDPLLKQVMPLSNEFIMSDGFSTDPLEEHDTVAEGLLHKYKNRVLMIVRAGCAINCRYCFRRHFPYQENSPNKQRWQQALIYIAEHSEISEVIFSGGDPLMANDSHLTWLVEQIEAITHVKRLRIHTRLPVVIPSRITKGLVDLLIRTRLKATMVLHINHANEIDDNFAQALEPLREARIPLFNQSVLLNGVNDKSDTLIALSEKMFDIGIIPYYLHLFDPVQGAAHFDVTEKKAVKIVNEMLASLPGFLMPKLVREIAGQTNKTPINLT